MDHYISSQFRESGSDSAFVYELNIPMDHTHISLRQITLPKTYYNVENGSNTFVLTGNTYTIPQGFYSVSSVVSSVNSLITPNSVAFSPLTGLMTFTSTTGGNTLSFPSTSRLWKILGFTQASTNSFSSLTLVSSNICNLSAIRLT